jgi:U3 small nucleolar RNA-associated protein 20
LLTSQLRGGARREGPHIGKGITRLLKAAPSTSHPISQDCFKLMAALIRECASYQPSSGQLRFLLSWAFSDLEESAVRQTLFSLLKVSISPSPSASPPNSLQPAKYSIT